MSESSKPEMKQSKPATPDEVVTRDGIPIPTLEQVREAVVMAWTDSTQLQTTPGSLEVCEHLRNAAECLDRMIEHAQPKQLQHDTPGPGGGKPCRRCGMVYSPKTAYVPCFVEGDTRETWLARLPEELRAELG